MLLSNINNTASNIHICCCCCCWSYHKKIMKRKWDCSWILTSRQPHRVTSGRITHTTLFCTSLTHVTKAHVCLLHCYNVKPPIMSNSLLQRQAPNYVWFTATTSSAQLCLLYCYNVKPPTMHPPISAQQDVFWYNRSQFLSNYLCLFIFHRHSPLERQLNNWSLTPSLPWCLYQRHRNLFKSLVVMCWVACFILQTHAGICNNYNSTTAGRRFGNKWKWMGRVGKN